ncbi:N-acetylated-alpha-linked acidic dipeptidase 2 isoform X3 [Octopus sinensis]|uniref:Glutamate carboxypeptidase 2 n=1 Tax=Octopus sinensis TaxID=2607531 RepID=A0A6P7T7I2_9MOLL|nr:N-acetylated-alpha-linked acidic dipeptidase 2 isoform X3 [Octopus sinensis]
MYRLQLSGRQFSNLETEDLVEQPPSLKIMSPSGIDKKRIFRDIILCIIFLICGILIGWFSKSTHHEKKNHNSATPSTSPDHSNQFFTSYSTTESHLLRDDPIEKILANLDKQRIKSNLRDYTQKPRLTGTPGEKELVDKIFNTWKENGLTGVVITPYRILMSYPNITQPNQIEIRFQNQTVFTSHFYEKTLRKEDDSSKLVPPYNSFAPSGIAEGPLIYVNYGRIEDFQYLHKNHSVNFKGSIVIARYGKIFRGDKLKIAAQYNASGMILYTDPADFNIGENKTYPDTWWLPEQAVQRGTVGGDGDYLTPLYPATEDAYRISLAEARKLLPKIPCQPIGYGDAQVLLSEMDGEVVPSDWQGKLPITYKIGPGHVNSSLTVRLQVNNYESITTTWNVIGYIKGELEPDRYVILGNHHDSWVYSAVDPLSGAASLTEITRVLGNMSKEGWKPRRTIVFCSWGGEEQGLIGSTEWVEEHMKELYERGVAYLNVDYALDFYEKLSINTSPLLQDVMYKSAKKVPNPSPHHNGTTLYDNWKHQYPEGDEPKVSYSLGSGSDMATFYQRAGVPSMDFFYTYDSEKWKTLSYPSYHTAYDTFYYYTKFVDPSFNYTLAISQLWSILACYLAEDKILEFDLRRYSNIIAVSVYDLCKKHDHIFSNRSVNIESLHDASKKFVQATEKFHDFYKPKIDADNPLQVRILNDKMIQLERTFIDPEGIIGKRQYKHVIFAPMEHDAYSDASFPGIKECIWKIENENADVWEELKQQISVATYTILTAAESLDEIGLGFNRANHTE